MGFVTRFNTVAPMRHKDGKDVTKCETPEITAGFKQFKKLLRKSIGTFMLPYEIESIINYTFTSQVPVSRITVTNYVYDLINLYLHNKLLHGVKLLPDEETFLEIDSYRQGLGELPVFLFPNDGKPVREDSNNGKMSMERYKELLNGKDDIDIDQSLQLFKDCIIKYKEDKNLYTEDQETFMNLDAYISVPKLDSDFDLVDNNDDVLMVSAFNLMYSHDIKPTYNSNRFNTVKEGRMKDLVDLSDVITRLVALEHQAYFEILRIAFMSVTPDPLTDSTHNNKHTMFAVMDRALNNTKSEIYNDEVVHFYAMLQMFRNEVQL